MKFEEKLIKLRKEKGLSQEELGEALNVTRQTISKWELGQSKPDMVKLKEISEFFQVSPDSLLNDDTIKKDKKENIKNIEYTDEVKPRKWLQIILIIIALIIIVILLNKVYLDHKAKEKDKSSNGIFDIFTNTDFNKERFNSKFEFHSGTKSAFLLKSLFDDVITNNKINKDHIITIIYDGKSINKADEITTLKQSLEEGKFEISLDYDEYGYVEKINIVETKKSIKEKEEKRNAEEEYKKRAFNSQYEVYTGKSFGTMRDAILDRASTNNKTNKEHIIYVQYKDKYTADSNEISSIKNSFDTFTECDISLEYDENGYVYLIKISEV